MVCNIMINNNSEWYSDDDTIDDDTIDDGTLVGIQFYGFYDCLEISWFSIIICCLAKVIQNQNAVKCIVGRARCHYCRESALPLL